MKLEYIIIFKEEGIPIYSQCYGSFCANVGFNDTLYSGFLSALTSMPSMFGDKGGLQSVEMGFTKLHFDKTTPSGHMVCVGIDKASIDDIDIENQLDSFYEAVNRLLEEDYHDQDWIETSSTTIQKFGEDLTHEAIYPNFPYFSDNEICSDTCPFDHEQVELNPETNQPLTMVEKFKRNYDKSLTWLYRLVAKIYLPLYRWFDLRGYRKRRKQDFEDNGK